MKTARIGLHHALLQAVALALVACGTARTLVLEPAQTNRRFSQVEIVANNPNVEVPAEVTSKFEGLMADGLYKSGSFATGPELRLVYTFISHEAGSRLERWFWGGLGNAGEGSITVLVRYLDSEERELGKTQVEGRIGSGFFGGSMDSALKKAVGDIVDYTVRNFSR